MFKSDQSERIDHAKQNGFILSCKFFGLQIPFFKKKTLFIYLFCSIA